MKTRKVSAHYIFPGNKPFLRYGILEFDEYGEIIRLSDTGGKLEESAGLEFYNGIIVPGFIVANLHEELSALSVNNNPDPVERQRIFGQFNTLNNNLIKSIEDTKKVIKLIYAIQELYPSFRLEELLAMFTSKSAIALGIENKYGSFAKGMKPGINVLLNPDLQNLKIKEENRFIHLAP